MDRFKLGVLVSDEIQEPNWMLEDLGYHPYRSQQPNGYSDFEKDWMSTEMIIRRIMYAKTAFHKYNVDDQISDNIHEKIIINNFDNSDEILNIVSRAKTNEEKHIILFNLPEHENIKKRFFKRNCNFFIFSWI